MLTVLQVFSKKFNVILYGLQLINPSKLHNISYKNSDQNSVRLYGSYEYAIVTRSERFLRT